MPATMRLYEDVLSALGQRLELAALPRMIFVVRGTATIAGTAFRDGEAWSGEEAASVVGGASGVTCWRFELAAADGADGASGSSRLKLAAPVETLPRGDLLLRGDSVAFPPGGCAYLHRHQGPGIRCLIEGGIRIDTHGASTSYGPGEAWYESGPEPVFAQGAADRATRFIRMMILPRALIGKSSIEYLKAEDKERPKSQSYKGFADRPIAWPSRNAS
jgi:hypothetical protein